MTYLRDWTNHNDHKMAIIAFGQQVKEFRITSGWTQTDIVRKLMNSRGESESNRGKWQKAISRLERGETSIDRQALDLVRTIPGLVGMELTPEAIRLKEYLEARFGLEPVRQALYEVLKNIPADQRRSEVEKVLKSLEQTNETVRRAEFEEWFASLSTTEMEEIASQKASK